MDGFELEIIDGVAVVKVDNSTATLRDAHVLLQTFKNDSIFDWKRIVLDLSKCTFVDSTFIGMIVKIFKMVNQKNTRLKLVFPQVTDIRSFQLVGISRVIECYESLDDAIESFDPFSLSERIIIDQEAILN
jgi:stage II sporulation protein AA (anti-sigma F factor antagonist)